MKIKSENAKSVLEKPKLPKKTFQISTSVNSSKETRLNSKGASLFLPILVFVVFLVGVWLFNTTTIYLLQKEVLYWNFFSHILMLALSVGVIALTKREFASSGFSLKNWRSDLRIAIVCIISAAAFIPSLIFPSIANTVVLNSVFSIAATLLALLFVSRKKDAPEKTESSNKGRAIITLAPVFFITAIAGSINYGLIASTVIFQFFFAGFGEEIMFRGYMQSRLNEGFGYPWKFAGVKFGTGLLITSILFGVLHLLNPFNPLQGQYGLAIWSGISSMVAGFLFGFIREKTGNVLAPSIAHGLVDLGQVVPLLL
jgi:membrane protease YdiL (CAAX protease family)